jgi:hypothetical protein
MSPAVWRDFGREIESAARPIDQGRLATILLGFAVVVAGEMHHRFPAGTDVDSAIQDAAVKSLEWMAKWDPAKGPAGVRAYVVIRQSLRDSARAQMRWARRHGPLDPSR